MISRSSKAIYIASGIAAGGVVYYTRQVSPEPDTLNEHRFAKYILSSKQVLSPTTSLFEIRPQHACKETQLPLHIRLQSLQIKQPELQIQRHYTPLSVIGPNHQFIVRRYPEGEVSRYLHRLPIASEVEIRGPVIDMESNQSWDEIRLFAGGTGIAVAMQLLEQIPSRTKLSLFYSVRSPEEILFMKQLTGVLDRNVEVKCFVDSERRVITKADIPPPAKDCLSIVCGPEGYVSFLAGPTMKPVDTISGLLGQKGYKTVVKL